MQADVVQALHGTLAELHARVSGICYTLLEDRGNVTAQIANNFYAHAKNQFPVHRTHFSDPKSSSDDAMHELARSILHSNEEMDINTIYDRISILPGDKSELLMATACILLGLPIPKNIAGLYHALTHHRRLHIMTQLLCELLAQQLASQPVILILENLHNASQDQYRILREIVKLCERYPIYVLVTATQPDPELSQLFDNLDSSVIEVPGQVTEPKATLTALSDRDQQALQAAAVLGRHFSPEVLGVLIDDPQYDPGVLADAGLLANRHRRIAFVDEHTRMSIYASMPADLRTRFHRLAAAYYMFGNPVMHACHLVYLEDDAAAGACLTAARALCDEYRLDQACIFFDKSIRLANTDADRFFAACRKADALLEANEYAAAVQAYDQAQRLTQDEQLQAQAWLGMAIALLQRKHHHVANQLLQRAQNILSSHRDHTLLARLYFALAYSAVQSHRYNDAITSGKIAFEYAVDALDTYWQARIAVLLGQLELINLNPGSAEMNLKNALALARDNGYILVELDSLTSLARLHLYKLELGDALARLNASIALANKLDNTEMLLQAQLMLSLYDLLKGQFANMLVHTEFAGQLCQQVQHCEQKSDVQSLQALACYYSRQSCSHDKASNASIPIHLAVQAVITPDREAALYHLITGQQLLHELSNPDALNFCFVAIEACIKHSLWETGEKLADHIITRMHAQPLLLYVMCGERMRLLARQVQ